MISSILPPTNAPCSSVSPGPVTLHSHSVIALYLDLKHNPSFAALGGYGSGRWGKRDRYFYPLVHLSGAVWRAT
jgi:hypothetical protein